ncbi:MAG: DnaD domain protein [Bacilli bacterium]|nr:DnaD domain protein [Bacilli bacterium]
MKKVSLYPADIYQVVDKSLLSETDKLILNMLYMPIIGSNAVVLYQKLQSETKNTFISPELSHHHLMTSMCTTLDNIKEARLRLEGIGLLKTYYNEGEINSYVYELYSPASAQEFFSHPVFNVVLYNNVGKTEYNRLINYFKVPNLSLREYEEITASFDNVFKTRNYTELEVSTGDLISKNKLLLNYELDYDFDLMTSSLPKEMFNEKCLNKSMKELITNLSFLYDIDPVTMADVVRASLNEKGNIDKEVLRQNTRKYYQLNNNNRLPSLLFKSQPEYLKSAQGDNTKKGKIIKVFESHSPYEFLKAKNKGAKPTEREMQILEGLLVDIKLNPAVINVLIDYVFRTNNNKLVKNYIETIATQWKRSNIETAEEAMAIAEKEHKKKYKNDKAKNAKVVPTWFDKQPKEESQTQEEIDDEIRNFIEEFKK